MTRCDIDECDRPHSARGWCKRHYERWRRHGDPNAREHRVVGDSLHNFTIKVEVGHPLGCWWWTGGVGSHGYGTFERTTAHRRAHELFKGEIPEGFDIDHLCRNKLCVNPDHLEVVTRQENVARGIAGHRMARLNRLQPEGWGRG